ncbi:MAG TPA: hypothetical protein DEA46_04815 [Candidatus Moranbacteria bacterium]|nr:hypothetical protein [Candidatus Moranbacteria bacterium]
MKKYKRMTALSLEELTAIVNGGINGEGCEGVIAPMCGGCGCFRSSTVPIGQAVNEIGIIFVEEGDKKAEKILANLIATDSFMAPGAYFYLIQKRDAVSSETESLLKQFEEDPKNQMHVENIREKLAESAEETA